MRKLILSVASLFLILGIIGCSNPNEITPDKMKTIKFLNETEMKALFSNTKVIGKSYTWNSSFDVDFKDNGTYSGIVSDGKKNISGTWNVNGETKCMQENGQQKCAKHFKEGDKYFTVKGNIITSEFTFKK